MYDKIIIGCRLIWLICSIILCEKGAECSCDRKVVYIEAHELVSRYLCSVDKK